MLRSDWPFSPGHVLPGSVHHPEAAVRPEPAAHRPLRSGRSGPGSGRRQLLREGTTVSLSLLRF